ncbi:carbohydrate kinase [Yersinia pseudotuberculosis]|uniref:ribokinase n=1 Tax=Yersinia pseudotuberculosis TaxID=633 RepID=UPI0004F6BA2E|nr:ribokinase [Yersinia pseudotuberculosis]AIN14698.1 pfkB carbohydrate kinase family protein [Yersinia pseudotuberculosis]AJJ08635.1 phosphomethylpyrimidine kinase family protein [Yersinia pseudotuberculosis]CNK52354.1 carbohydrate kinase [Yersinia pseudotuberculosis]CNL22713.1 carbohydrate kinase [Yersinia pseudotuberculosis]SUP87939.1 carbohydrate kinase [Yersinia pseudotuberculosis]
MSVFILGSYAKALVMTTDRIPLAGETLIGYDFRQTWGGKGSDMAVQAVRLGAEVAYAGVVGDDTFGHEFVGLMQEEGVNIDALTISGELPTGAGLIVKDKEARNVIVVDMGANKLFTPALVDSALSQLKQSNVVLTQLEIPLETALYGLQRAKEFGKITILNPAPARDLRGLDLSAIDYLTPNETEARVALGLPPDDPRSNREIANLLLETGCQYVVMTLGESGSAVFGRNDTQEIPPCIIDVVDSNGAGDSFNAALAVALDEGLPISEAVLFANATAALCCMDWETVPSYRYREDVDAFMRSITVKEE